MRDQPKFIVGFKRPSPHHTMVAQDAALRVVKPGQTYEDVDELLLRLRDNDTVALLHAHLLSDPKAKRSAALRKSFRIAFAAVHEKGTVLELSTGLHSARPKELIRMERAAVEFLNRARWHESGGRPPRDWSDESANARMEAVWHDLRVDTNEAAIAKLEAEGFENLSASVLLKKFGASGRSRLKPDRRHVKKRAPE